MAGGTSRKDHSEIGSSYVHFNFTPHQDKATASLIGDVPNGVFMDQNAIFLGGQGGLVGPSQIAYGSVIAAGGICRVDLLEQNKLHIPEVPPAGTRDYEIGVYRRGDRLIQNNLIYIGNLFALREWYRNIRTKCVRDKFDQSVLDGGLQNLDLILKERIKRLGDVANKFEYSFRWLESHGGKPDEILVQKSFNKKWPELQKNLEALSFQPLETFVQSVEVKSSYIETIQSLEKDARESGRAWLQSIVDETAGLWT